MVQTFNMDQANFAAQNMKETAMTVKALSVYCFKYSVWGYERRSKSYETTVQRVGRG